MTFKRLKKYIFILPLDHILDNDILIPKKFLKTNTFYSKIGSKVEK